MRMARDARRGDVAITEWIALSLRTGGMECRHRLRPGTWAGRLGGRVHVPKADRRA